MSSLISIAGNAVTAIAMTSGMSITIAIEIITVITSDAVVIKKGAVTGTDIALKP
jgi:hypothetical protein